MWPPQPGEIWQYLDGEPGMDNTWLIVERHPDYDDDTFRIWKLTGPNNSTVYLFTTKRKNSWKKLA